MAIEITRIMHSGFVAYDDSRLVQLRPLIPTMHQVVINNQANSADFKNYYDTEIDDLCKRYYATPELIKTMAFREEVLEAWRRIFDSTSITPWFMLQARFKSVSYTHERYLKEIINYVYFNQRKTMANLNYRRILIAQIGEANRQEKEADKRKGIDACSLEDALRNVNTSVVEFLYNWSKTTAGVTDMIETLDVIFGLRPDATVFEQ